MVKKEDRRLRVGVLGCGQIAQAAHFESCTKARNVELHAICDVATDLLDRMAAIHRPARTYSSYEAMLADPDVEAVIIATSDVFHVPASIAALNAGKHVLCEKPLAADVEEAEKLRAVVDSTQRVMQIGHMKRFDPGLQAARHFVESELGAMLAFKGWYCDSTQRYVVTDAVQPLIVRSMSSRKPAGNPKSDPTRYYMLAHGSHLLDTARYLAGEIVEVDARLREQSGALCWFVNVAFASGALGHLELTVPARMDWHEGFHLHGQYGSVFAKTYNPWLFKSSDVDIFRERDLTTTRVLGADGHFFRRQMEAFAAVILDGGSMTGADVHDGVASVRGMAAIAESVRTKRPVRLDHAYGII
jgi:Predicted dehydrogenases and related proteins